jgi:cytidyltransferase-like protein
MPKNVLVWGTFDLLHEGHRRYLQAARGFGDRLYVVVVPDKAVVENKGRRPIHDERTRRRRVQVLRHVTTAFIDSIEQGLRSAEKIRPDIVCVGYDQSEFWTRRLAELLASRGLHPEFRRLEKYAEVHTSHLIQGAAKDKHGQPVLLQSEMEGPPGRISHSRRPGSTTVVYGVADPAVDSTEIICYYRDHRYGRKDRR